MQNKKVRIIEAIFFLLIVAFSLKVGFEKVIASWTVTDMSNPGYWSAVDVADNEPRIYIASGNSNDGVSGLIWYTDTDNSFFHTQISTGSQIWADVVVSDDGNIMAGVIEGGPIHVSDDSGSTWRTNGDSSGSRDWSSITSSADGSKLAAGVSGSGYIYTSSDSGASWNTNGDSSGLRNWQGITSSSDGTKLAAVVYGGYIYTSTDSGQTWTTNSNSSGSRNWSGITSSDDGTKLAAIVSNGYIYTSTNSGVTWTEQTGAGSRNWTDVDMSSDGGRIVAAAGNASSPYISIDGGSIWSVMQDVEQLSYIAIDGAGTKIVGAMSYGAVSVFEDVVEPIVASISSDKADGTYTVGEVIDIDVTFSEAVTSTGNVTVTLETGTTDRTCTFTVANSLTGTCNYTVQEGDVSADLAVSSISGTITDNFFNEMSVFVGFTNLSSNKDIVVGENTWTQHVSSGNKAWTRMASSADGTKLAATVSGGYIYTSTDSGATWTERTDAGSRGWSGITSSSDGTKLAAVVASGYIYTSTDSGATWGTQSNSSGSRNWQSITSSEDGTKLAAAAYNGYIYTSSDSGATWTTNSNSSGSRGWQGITSSSDGTKLAAVDSTPGYIYTSSDSGATWTTNSNSSGSRNWRRITSSSDGTKLAATVTNGYIYTSSDSGVTWTTNSNSSGSRGWYGITSSSDGTKLAAGVYDGYLYVSADSGQTWISQTDAGLRNWYDIASSDDGSKLAAPAYNGYIYTTTLGYDVTAPTITSVSSSKADGTYGVGEVIDIDVTFSEAVTSTGNVTVTLETGTTDRTCTFTVSNADTGTCNYTVQAGDESDDLTVSSISGTIADQEGNAMVNFTPATNLAANKDLFIDTTPPPIQTLSPLDNATDVAIDSNLVMIFNSVISVGTGNILIKKTSDDSTVLTIDVEGDEISQTGLDRITINPESDLSNGTSYYIIIPNTAVSDNYENYFEGISDSTTWNFTTVAAAEETVEEEEAVEETPTNRAPSSRSRSGGSSSSSNNTPSDDTPSVVSTIIDSLLTELKSTIQSEPENTSKIQDLISKMKEEFNSWFSSDTSTTEETPTFTKDLELNDEDPEVKLLQQFLNTQGFTVATSGPGSIGQETTFFGRLTQIALSNFQMSVGIVPAVGYFGSITRNFINSL
ncbi:MAG: Ig-like domain-containing protein [Candidatus Paceibacterota bacterium]